MERGGTIVFAGTETAAFQRYGDSARIFPLQGQTLIPGFIERHAHPVIIATLLPALESMAPHTWGLPHRTYPGVTGREAYLQAGQEIVNTRADTSETVFNWGYHQGPARWAYGCCPRPDKRPPARVIWHRSGHEVYLNNAALHKYGVQEDEMEEKEQEVRASHHLWERGYLHPARTSPLCRSPTGYSQHPGNRGGVPGSLF